MGGIGFNPTKAANEPGVDTHLADFLRSEMGGGLAGQFLTAADIASCARVSRLCKDAVTEKLRGWREWRDEGGLLIGLYGKPTANDRLILKNFQAIARGERGEFYTYEELLKLLTSFVRIRDDEMVLIISDNMRRTIEANPLLSAWEKGVIKDLLPDADVRHLAYLIGGEVCFNDKKVILSAAFKRGLILRVVNDPRASAQALGSLALHAFSSSEDRPLVLYGLKKVVTKPGVQFKDMVLLSCYQSMLMDYRESNRSCDLMLRHEDATFGWRVMLHIMKCTNLFYFAGYNLYCLGIFLWDELKRLIKY